MKLTPLRTITIRRSGSYIIVHCCKCGTVGGSRGVVKEARDKATKHNMDCHHSQYDVLDNTPLTKVG